MAQRRFRKQVKDWAGQTALKNKALLKALAFKLHARIALLTPVDTGRARASWNLVAGEHADLSVANEGEGGTGKVFAPDANVYTISNNLPYISVLETGSSDQARKGMVKVAIAELRSRGIKSYLQT